MFSQKSWFTDRRKRCGCSSAVAHWLRRFAWRFAIKRAAAIPFPAMSPIDEPEPFLSQVQEIVVVAAHLARLDAQPGVFEGAAMAAVSGGRAGPVPVVAISISWAIRRSDSSFSASGAALGLDGPALLVEAHQREGVAIDVLEAGKHPAPDRHDSPAASR